MTGLADALAALSAVDADSAARADSALAVLAGAERHASGGDSAGGTGADTDRIDRARGSGGVEERLAVPDLPRLQRFLTRELSVAWRGRPREQHEVAWSLADLFERAGLSEHAALSRSTRVHETITLWRWTQSFSDVPEPFWHAAMAAAERGPAVPPRLVLSVSSAHALLVTVGAGLALTADGQLPLGVVRALDDRFRWTQEFPWMQVRQERDVAPLRLLHEHLVAQRLLELRDGVLRRTALGERCTGDGPVLWLSLVDPAPRWTHEFERDTLGVLAASVLRAADFTLGRVAEEVAHVLSAKWQPAGSPAGAPSGVYDGAAPVAQAWYRLGVPLGWWDTGRGAADRRPNALGRAAATAVFRAVAAGPPRPRDTAP